MQKYRHEFGEKAHMLSFDEVEEKKLAILLVEFVLFGVNDGVSIYLDESLKKRFTTVFPACGEPN